MKKVLKIVLAAIALSSLAACMVVPARVDYVGPRVGVGVVAPYPVYRHPYPYYGRPMRPHHYGGRGWDRRW